MSETDGLASRPSLGTNTANSVGDVTGSAMVQAHSIHGDVHFHAPPGLPSVPQQLPPPPNRFAGRVRELAAITERFSAHVAGGPPVIVLRGQTGVGKSAVALQWLHQYAEAFADGRLYAELTRPDGEPVSEATVLGQFLRGLGIAPDQVPATVAEQTSLFRTLTAGKALAVLLDDAQSAAQVRALMPTSARCIVLVTTRKNVIGLLTLGADELPVTPMDDDDALSLLRAYLGDSLVDAEPDTAHELVHLCGGLPMALCVAAALTASRPRRTMRRMVERLSDDDRRLDLLSVDDASVRAALDVSYQDLTEPAAVAYRALGAHPGARVSVELVAAATAQPLDVAADALDELVDANFLIDLTPWPDAIPAYRLHDLARLHARDAAVAAGEFDEVAARIDGWFEFVATAAGNLVMPARRVLPVQRCGDRALPLPSGFEHRQVALRWFDDHLADLIAVMRDAHERGLFAVACRLGDALQPLFVLHKNYPEALVVGEIALASALAWPHPGAEHNMRKRLSRTHATLGEFDKARDHAQAMLAAAADPSREASAHKTVGLVAARSGDHASAMTSFDRSLALYRSLGKARSVGLLLIDRGAGLSALGSLERASAELTEAHQVLAALEPADDYNAARAEALLSAVVSRRGEHERAHQLACHALAVFDEQGSTKERARTHRVLADNFDRQGRAAQAAEHRAEADVLDNPLPD